VLSSGRAELQEALEIALAADSPIAGTTLNNLAVLAIWEGDFRLGDEIYPEAQRLAERFGDRDAARFVRGNAIYGAYIRGRWDEALDAADAFVAECASSPHYQEGLVRRARGAIRLARGDLAGAAEDHEFDLESGRKIKDPQRIIPTLAEAAVNFVLLGRQDEARAVAREAIALARENVDMTGAANDLVLVARRLDIGEELREVVQLAPEGRGRT
jgi:tetratricopeptide (TPR) repeat protein